MSPGRRSIRVVLADEHAVFREGIRCRIDRCKGIKVIAECTNMRRAHRACLVHGADILLCDIKPPGSDICNVIRRMRKADLKTKVIVLSGIITNFCIQRVIESGALGYVSKCQSFATVRKAIRRVLAGETYYCPEIEKRIAAGAKGRKRAVDRLSLLTPRQHEVFIYLARGLTTKQIAKLMCVTTKTVEAHKICLMTKLKIHDRVNLARFAYREGIVSP